MAVSEPVGKHPPEDDTALLTAALNHGWAWYDGRLTHAYQMLNYYLVSTAVLLTAYASAIDGKHYGLAAALAVVRLALTAAATTFGVHEVNSAEHALPALARLQEQIARRLDIDEISMAKSSPTPEQRRTVIGTALALATLLNLSALIYAPIHGDIRRRPLRRLRPAPLLAARDQGARHHPSASGRAQKRRRRPRHPPHSRTPRPLTTRRAPPTRPR